MAKKKRRKNQLPPLGSKRTKRTGLSQDLFQLLDREVFLLILEMLAPTDMRQLAKASLVLETWMPYRIVVRNPILVG
jgi:hypothetical protein